MYSTPLKDRVIETGAERLKKLRLECVNRFTKKRISQADVETETERIGNAVGRKGIGEGNLTNYETRGQKPSLDNLNLLVDALLNLRVHPLKMADIRYLFSIYDHDLYKRYPSKFEKMWAIKHTEERINALQHPAYMLDNALVPLVFNDAFYECMLSKNESLKERLLSMPYHGAIFDHQLRLYDLVENPEVLVAVMKGLRVKYERCGRASWFKIEEFLENERFKYYWDQSANADLSLVTQSTYPLLLRLPGGTVQSFTVFGEPMLQDDRFRLIQYIPTGM